MSLTRRQREILEFLRQFLRKHGYAPSLLEIGRAFSLSSSATIHKHLCALEARGAIRRSRGRRRYMELVDSPSSGRLVDLPLLGSVPAGKPLEALEVEERISVPEFLVSGTRAYVLRVRGDSMREEQIRDGDYVVVEDRPVPENGETVVALLHGEEVTLKKFHRERGKVRLSPANPAYEPMVLPAKEVRIQGIVRGLLRRY
ncbi:MAG: transcriptional repressor LexA [Acidobacteria bacterium]|nr:transcriptional repressor LexA [Acidobacteriota bacterium]MCI0567046.1 transcriptional repressor LexA [Acidobacteriota bacterium]